MCVTITDVLAFPTQPGSPTQRPLWARTTGVAESLFQAGHGPLLARISRPR